MKQILFANNRMSSERASRHITMPQLLHRVVAILMLAMTVTLARAATNITSLSQITDPNGTYKLVADVDASGSTMIENFTGYFDGGYHTISGLTSALFDNINGGTVKNVRLADVSISGGTDVGALANTATGNAKIYNCGVLSGSISGSGSVGGLIGKISGGTKVVNNYNYAEVSGGTYAAGVVGNNAIENNYVAFNPKWNDDFAQGVITGDGIRTYAKDITNTRETSGMQPVTGWTMAVASADAQAAGVARYGSGFWYGSPGNVIPDAGPTGTNGYALGMVAVWQATVQYTHDVSLPAGSYTLEVPVYNQAGTTAFVQNRIGVTVNGTNYYASAKTYAVGQWTMERISFTLNQQRTVTISVGYQSANVGSAGMPHLFIDRVKIISGEIQENMIANCVNYGTEVSGSNTYPVYGGTDLDNKKNPLYDFFLYDGASYREDIESTNGALPAEARFLNRFEYVRATLNAEKKLAAYYLFNTQNKTDQDEIGKWVLDKEIAPYPVIKPWGKYPSLVNPDVSNRTVGTLNVNISGYGSVSLPISDQLEKEFDYGYHKVQLPYYNDYFNDNYKANSVVTGWKITSVSGGTAGSFTTSGNNAYNFADRNCTQKDLFNVSGRVFAQGGYYYVPEGVTGITIEPYWANDVVYVYDATLDRVFGMGYTESGFGPAYTPTFTVPNGAKTSTSFLEAHNALGKSTNVYDHAIVLIGNVNHRRSEVGWNGSPVGDSEKAYTLMSIDEDRDNEPDYCQFYGHVSMELIPPTRFDFVHQVGISWVKKPMGETLLAYSGIAMTRGHFEITETAFARFTEFETGRNNQYVADAPLIFNAGLIDQFVMTRYTTTDKVNYAIVGGHTYFNAYTPGCHATDAQKTKFFPVSVMGGEYEEFYLTGRNANVTVDANNDGRVYTNGGKMGTFAGGYWEQLNGNAYIRFDHTKVGEFYGGSVNPAKPITGNIDIIINNSDVEFFCAGPKAGNMTQGKTVTTVANNTKFGTYVGAGYGGSSVARVEMRQNVEAHDYVYFKNTFFSDYFNNDYLKYVNDRGILIRYAIEFMPASGGEGASGNPSHVTRFFNEYAQLSLARTYNVTSTLNGCTITGNYYGGPWSGTVGTETGTAPSVTSVLNGCTVLGSVFGGGKSAEIPTITVYPKEASALKDPLYNGQFGVYYQKGEDKFPVYPTGTEYTWVKQTGTTPKANATAHTLETNVDLTNLGTIFGNTVLTINGGTIAGNVFGAGDASKVTGTTTVTITGNATIANDVYGGANQANVGGNSVVDMLSGSAGNIFGANNISGIKNGTVTVNINQQPDNTVLVNNNVYGGGNQANYTGNPLVNMINGTVNGSVFGGGLSAKVTGDTDVEVTGGNVITAVYGGGALADVTGSTTVNLFGGTVNDVYGGGLGRLEDKESSIEAVEALVGGDTNVTLGKSITTGETTTKMGSIVNGSIFGCNNLNGTPQGHAKVTIVKTTPRANQKSGEYDVYAVYGGGNKAAYIPTSDTDFAEVEVIDCDNVIQYVYGGGNAASSPATKVTINGGTIYNVFGGGNGKTEVGAEIENPGADVGYLDWKQDEEHQYGEGTTNVYIYGGTITSVFGGSNTKGNIRVSSNVTLEDHEVCEFQVGDVYGAGNEAEMYGNGNLFIDCIPGLKEIYGGAKNADIYGNVTLTITNGEFENVFGGNNLGGNIEGGVTVNIEETGCRPVIIGELYGGGNLAAYTAPTDATKYGDNAGKFPMVNVKSFTSIETVYGAGLGMTDAKIDALSTDDLKEAAKALGKTDAEIGDLSDDALKALTKPYFKAKGVVHGSPQVNINMIEGAWKDGWPAEGTKKYPAISNKWNNQLGTIGTVYGGGNAANVEGDTYVNIGTVSTISLVSGTDHSNKDVKGVNISGNIYGGGNQADVTGKTRVQIGPAE